MIIRSITQLPLESNRATMENGRMEMSIPLTSNPGRYCSKQVQYSEIRNDIHDYAISSMVDTYNMDNSDGPIDVSALHAATKTISAEDMAFSGIKRFNTWPCISANFPTSLTPAQRATYGDDGEYIIPNMKKVREVVNDNVVFMSTADSLVAEGNPLPHHLNPTAYNANVPESLDYANTIGLGKFYYWQIDDGMRDSSQSVKDANSGSKDGYEKIRDTGNLVVWGWLAENDVVAPPAEQCWVAMYAKIKCENGNATQVDVPIAVKPWIRGVNSPILQYVGFNIPVKAGLEIKIMTGFPVNGKSGGGFQNQGSMTFLDGWRPNSFFGYVIK